MNYNIDKIKIDIFHIVNFASKELKIFFTKKIQVFEKPDSSLVSEADKKIEQILVSKIFKKYPNSIFVAEEGTKKSTHNLLKDKLIWHIDPIDGTHNFVNKMPLFCISIGLEINKELKFGVIEVPFLNQKYWAIKNKGAYLGSKKIKVTQKKMKQVLLTTGFSTAKYYRLKQWERVKKVIIEPLGIRRTGTAAFDLAMVANGSFGGFWEEGLKSWDSAAGVLLVREAGGRVTDFNGKPYTFLSDNLIAGSPLIHKQLVKIFKSKN